MDCDVLNVLKKRELYDKYARFIKPSSLGEEAYNIFKGMGEWLKHSPAATEIDWKSFAGWWCLVRHAKMDPAKQAVYKEMFKAMEEMKVPDEADIKPLMDGLITRDHAAQIAEQALRISDGEFGCDFTSIIELVEKRNTAIGKVDGVDRNVLVPTLDALESVTSPGLQWRLECLNESCGDLRKGDFVVVGTRPDTGKTTFLASESTYMAPQLPEGKRVLWINNEEDGNKVFRRIIQSALGWTSAKMDSHLPVALAEYEKLMGGMDRIVMLNKADVHVRDVDHLCEKYDAGLLIFDQLWKVHGFDAEAGNEVVRQTMLFNWARERAKQYAPVITVHQADGTAEGQKWIDMSRLYGSKTGIQGEADAIITIGRLPEEGNKRYLYVPKNKMAGGNPAMRNGRYEIEIVPELGRWKEYK